MARNTWKLLRYSCSDGPRPVNRPLDQGLLSRLLVNHLAENPRFHVSTYLPKSFGIH
jgi:hypothetical protein